MSAEITVVFHIDLTRPVSYDESKAIQALQKTIKDAELPNATMNMNGAQNIVIPLPEYERVLADLFCLCNDWKFPYKTLWLNDSAQWKEGGKP